MFDVIFHYISRPFLGLVTLVRLFSGGNEDSDDPSVASLKFVRLADSVFVQVVIRNGTTPKIKELLEGGVVVKTTCTFACGDFSKQWERRLQYNPVKRCLFSDGTSDGVFESESLAVRFNHIAFFLSDCAAVKKMQSAPAKLKIASTIEIDAMSIGEKDVWPERIVAEFIVPELSIGQR